MATGKETSYNYNNNSYSATGYPFSGGQLKLQMSYSTSVHSADNLQSIVYLTVSLACYTIEWSYVSGREVNVYWNGNKVAQFNPPNLYDYSSGAHVLNLGSTSFIVAHNSDGTCTGELKVEWASTRLVYTIGGVTIDVTELGCKATVSPEKISEGTVPTDVFSINGKSFLSILQRDGLEISRAEVNKKSVITMDGTEWAKEKKRHAINVKVLDMSSEQWAEYAAYLATNPGQVTYKDDEDGAVKTSTFYILNIKQTKRMVIPGVTYLTGISFELSEKTAT